MTADQYQVQVLEQVLFDYYWRKSEEKGQVVFQQDGAPSHCAKSTTAWLNRNHIEIFPLPANSQSQPNQAIMALAQGYLPSMSTPTYKS